MTFHLRARQRSLACLLLLLGVAASPAMAEADPLSVLGTRATTGAAPGYLPDRDCRTCHAQIFDAYQHVGMAQSFKRPADAVPMEAFGQEFFHPPSRRYYRIDQNDDGLLFRRYQRDAAGAPINAVEIPIDWVMGSGNRARSYFYHTEFGELFMLPIGWYSETTSWGMSPGFDSDHHDGIHRQIKRECMFCHNAYPEAAAGSDHHGHPDIFPRELPQGTGCQRCHGPGADHVRAALDGTGLEQVRAAIVNPARLPPEERDSVCFQCHMLPAVDLAGARRFDRGYYSFRPGESLSGYMVHVDVTKRGQDREDRFEINHHGYRFYQSACYRESEGAFGCISCHDPHVKPDPAGFRRAVASTCVGCHVAVAARHTAELSAFEEGCVDCHMPQRRTSDVVLVTMTDHRIARGPFDRDNLLRPLKEQVRPVTGVELLDFGSPPDGHEAPAYRAVAALQSNRSVAAATRGLAVSLPELAAAGKRHAAPYVWLARGQLQLGEFDQAAASARTAIAIDDSVPAHHGVLGVALLAGGDFSSAITSLGRSLALHPDPETHFNLAIAHLSAGNLDAAEREIDAAIALRPHMAAAWVRRGQILESRGDLGAARDALARAIALEPRDQSAYQALLAVLRRTGDFRDAARYRVMLEALQR
jgi:predicted CXXCH cytochrome family protein